MDDKQSPRLFDLMTMGLASALMVGLPTGLGVVLDDWLHSSPVCTLVGLAFGIIAGIGSTVYKVKRLM